MPQYNTWGTPSSIVGVEQAIGRRRCARLVVLAFGMLGSAASAQERLIQSHDAGEPEGRLLAFYSSAMVFSPLGAPTRASRWSVSMEATYLPRLSEAQRRPGIDKPESSNLSPVLPRPRVTLRTALGVLEASWVPPVRVADAEANLVGLAFTRSLGEWRGVSLAPRISLSAGKVRGAITCNRATTEKGGPDLAVYYAAVCHGNNSDDWFQPRLVAGELVASRAIGTSGAYTYVAAGARVDRSRFDIGVQRRDGTRDTDHPILRLRDTRPHLAAGVRWPLGAHLSTVMEWFHAPGSITTLRASVAVSGGPRP